MRFHKLALFTVLALGLVLAAPRAWSQAQTTGGISGTITDPSGAAIPGASVVATNDNNGAVHKAQTDARGGFRFALLQPSTYTLVVNANGFHQLRQKAVVQLGQVTTASLKVALASSTQTVEVTGAAPPLLQTENGNIANTISEAQAHSVPVPGGDLQYLAQLAPGATNTGGTFPSMYGMPTSSNMYTLDGMEDIDPYGNSTNGGASNLLLGLNEVQEATTVSNGYSGKYGTLAGSNINMVTKSGGNRYHGNLIWKYNGQFLDGNNFFNNAGGTPRPTSMAKQWAGSLGGPIIRNKLFFFVDNEGLAIILPSSSQTLLPTPAFEQATIANLTANHPASLPFYQNMFKLYDGAPGASRATPVAPSTDSKGNIDPGGCGTFRIPGSPTAPCAQQYYSNATAFPWEDITTAKVDWNISQSDHAYIHWLLDRGVQSTGIDPINPVFSAISKQPEFQVQGFWSHSFGSTGVNALTLATQHYTAIFGPADLDAALQTFPTEMSFSNGSFTTLGGGDGSSNSGRSVTRVQLSDDFTKTMGPHALDFGFTGSKYLANTRISRDIHGVLSVHDLDAFYNGGVDANAPGSNTRYTINFPAFGEVPLRLTRFGFYADDQWTATPTLSLTLSLRLDHPTGPSCATNCFAGTPDFQTMSHDPTEPYNAVVRTGLSHALLGLKPIEWQPRFGFAWQPLGANSGTVVRGGFGLFADNFAINLATGFLANLPENPGFSPSGNLMAPGEASNLFLDAQNAYTALASGFSNGATLADLQAAVPGFKPPVLTNAPTTLYNPTYYKYNLEVQQSLWHNAAVKLGYTGNYGVHELMENEGLNAYAANFAGLPAVAPDPRFGQVTMYQSNGTSNYNGMTAVFHDNFSSGVLQLSYTWSHGFDEGFGSGQTRTIEYPNDLRATYGPSDQDVRHVFNANYVWNVPFQKWFGGSSALAGGWQVSGTFMARGGLPFSVTDGTSDLANQNFGGTVLANFVGGAAPNCSSPDQPCLSAAMFSAATNGFGLQQRNYFRGPGYWDTDMNVRKTFNIPGWESGKLHLEGSAYNLLNHANFRNPGSTFGSSQIGKITRTAHNAASILGNNGGDSSPRLVELQIGISF